MKLELPATLEAMTARASDQPMPLFSDTPDAPTMGLRQYQEDAVTALTSYARAKWSALCLVAPTGSGKTAMVMGFILATQDQHSAVVIACPSLQTEANFTGRAWRFRLADGSVLERATDGSPLLCSPRASADKLGVLEAVVVRDVRAPGYIFPTTHQQLARWGVEALSEDLTGALLVVDEAHHVAASTQIGDIARTWRARGGRVLYVTATPYRGDRQSVVPDDAQTYVWPLSRHVATGHAPQRFSVRTLAIANARAETVAQLAGVELSEAEDEHGTSYEVVVRSWIADGCPKSVFIVPSQRSQAWTARLLEAIHRLAPNARVLNAVGTDPETAQRLTDAMECEQRVRHVRESRVDIVIACRRFDEGTDWPLCSHVYNYGVPGSMTLLMQRWGRTFRNKREIVGHPHPEQAELVMLVAQASQMLAAEFEKKYDGVMSLIACLMSDWSKGSPVGQRLWSRMEELTPTRQSLALRYRSSTPDDVRLQAQNLVASYAQDFERQTGRPPTAAETSSYLTASNGKVSDKVKSAARLLVVEQLTDQEPDLIRLVAARFAALDSFDQFDVTVSSMLADFGTRTVRYGERVRKFQSNFLLSGSSAAPKPDLTVDLIVAAMKSHKRRTKEWPNLKSGDATIDFGFPETWSAVEVALSVGVRGLPGGTSIAKVRTEECGVEHRHGLALLTEELIWAAAQRFNARTGQWPTSASGDATEDFGHKRTWGGVDASLRLGGRGLPGGSALGQLLRAHGVTPKRGRKPKRFRSMI